MFPYYAVMKSWCLVVIFFVTVKYLHDHPRRILHYDALIDVVTSGHHLFLQQLHCCSFEVSDCIAMSKQRSQDSKWDQDMKGSDPASGGSGRDADLGGERPGGGQGPGTERPDNQVALLTYNFFMRSPFISDYKGDSKDERLHEFIHRVLPRFDIIALQEAFSAYSSRIATLEEAARAAGFVTAQRGPQRNLRAGRLVDGGLLVLSRWPAAVRAHIEYKDGVTVDRLAAKGATYTLLVHPTRRNVRVHMFTTHLQASYSIEPRIDDPSVRCRHHQLYELSEFIRTQVQRNWWRDVSSDNAACTSSKERLSLKRKLKHKLDQQQQAEALTTSHDQLSPPPTGSDPELAGGYEVVIVAGDLNVNSMQDGRHEYELMLKTLSSEGRFKVRDLLVEQKRENYTQVPWIWLSKRRNELNMDVMREESSRLDYILTLQPTALLHTCEPGLNATAPEAATTEAVPRAFPAADSAPALKHPEAEMDLESKHPHDIKVEIDPLESINEEYKQLSDHMGLFANISLPQAEQD